MAQRYAKPRAFKNVKHLPLQYSANKNVLMTAALFTEWMLKLNLKMKMEKRKIALIVENYADHPDIDLSHTRLVFLCPNTTSVTKPMDAGFIKNLKLYHKILPVRFL